MMAARIFSYITVGLSKTTGEKQLFSGGFGGYQKSGCFSVFFQKPNLTTTEFCGGCRLIGWLPVASRQARGLCRQGSATSPGWMAA
jgi:hypothetical protein